MDNYREHRYREPNTQVPRSLRDPLALFACVIHSQKAEGNTHLTEEEDEEPARSPEEKPVPEAVAHRRQSIFRAAKKRALLLIL